MSETASPAAPEMIEGKPGIFKRIQNGLAFLFASKIAVVGPVSYTHLTLPTTPY